MSSRPLAIVGSGLVCGVGLTAPASCAAIRCGLNGFQETRFMGATGDWIVGSEVPWPEPCNGTAKLGRMLSAVVEESFAAHPALSPQDTPIIVCIAERERPGRPSNLKQAIVDALASELPWHPESKVVSQGRVGGVVALREARELVYGGRHPAVVVAAVDSYLSGPTLSAYEEAGRLLTPANSNGFIPGEAAAAVVVKRPVADAERQLIALGLGFGVEPATVESDRPLRADGLVEAIRNALRDGGTTIDSLDFRISDVSGEQYGFKEAALALARLLRIRKAEFDIWHPADCIGEVGAAAGVAALNVLWAAARKGYLKGAGILSHFGNDDGKRAAAVLAYTRVGAA